MTGRGPTGWFSKARWTAIGSAPSFSSSSATRSGCSTAAFVGSGRLTRRAVESTYLVVDCRVRDVLPAGVFTSRDRRQRAAVWRYRHGGHSSDSAIGLCHDLIRARVKLLVRIRHVFVDSLNYVVLAVKSPRPFEMLNPAAQVHEV